MKNFDDAMHSELMILDLMICMERSFGDCPDEKRIRTKTCDDLSAYLAKCVNKKVKVDYFTTLKPHITNLEYQIELHNERTVESSKGLRANFVTPETPSSQPDISNSKLFIPFEFWRGSDKFE